MMEMLLNLFFLLLILWCTSGIFPPWIQSIVGDCNLVASMSLRTELPITRASRTGAGDAVAGDLAETSLDTRDSRLLIVLVWTSNLSLIIAFSSVRAWIVRDKSRIFWDIVHICWGSIRQDWHVYTSTDTHFLWYGSPLQIHCTIA